jgi:DNA-binding transcriptional ArsR family regulator
LITLEATAMTLRLRLADTDDERVAFGCSPAYEALRSLHVMTDVKHHPLHISWVLRTRERMTAELAGEVNRFAFWYRDRPLVFPEIWPPAEVRSWPDELSALRETPIEPFADQLIHGALARGGRGPRIPLRTFLRDTALRDEALAQVDAHHPASVPVLQELADDPERCRARFASFLSSYWDACLGPDWPKLEAHLLSDIARRGRAQSRRGLADMLAELSPHIHADRTAGEVVVSAPGRQGSDPIEVSLTPDDQVLLLPSHFIWPELTAVVHRHRRDGRVRHTVSVVYALAEMARQGRAPVPPEDLLKLLRAAGDATRLQVLQLLARRPRSTREIAGLIGLTEAAISKHLKLLQDAGWVEPARHSYYVYYHLVRDSCGRLAHGMEDLLA